MHGLLIYVMNQQRQDQPPDAYGVRDLEGVGYVMMWRLDCQGDFWQGSPLDKIMSSLRSCARLIFVLCIRVVVRFKFGVPTVDLFDIRG